MLVNHRTRGQRSDPQFCVMLTKVSGPGAGPGSLRPESGPSPSPGSTVPSWTPRLSWDPSSQPLSPPVPASTEPPASPLGSGFGSEKQTDKREATQARVLAELSPRVSPGPVQPGPVGTEQPVTWCLAGSPEETSLVSPCPSLLSHSLFSLLVAFQTTISESIKRNIKSPIG